MAVDLFSLVMNLKTTGVPTATAELKGVEVQGVKTAASLNTVATEVKGVAAATTATTSGISRMGLAIGGLVTAGIAATAALAFVKSSIRDAADSQNSYVGLRTAVLNAGLSFRDLKPHLDAVAGALQRTSVFTDEEAREGLARLITVTQDVGKAEHLLAVAADLAAFKHISLMSAVQIVARVQAGYVRGLQDLGVTSKDAAEATAQLEARVRGAADAAGNTFTGSTIRLAHAWSEVKEAVGAFVLNSGLTEFLQNSAREVQTLANWIGRLNDFLHPGAAGIRDASTADLTAELAQLRAAAPGIPAQVGNPSIGLPMHDNPALAANRDRQVAIQRELVQREIERSQAATATATAAERTTGALDKQKDKYREILRLMRAQANPFGGDFITAPDELPDAGGFAPTQLALQRGGEAADIAGLVVPAAGRGRSRRGNAANAWFESMLQAGEQAAQQFSQLGQNLGATVAQGFAAAIGAAVTGKNPFKAFGNVVLAGLGSIFTQMGQALIAYGITMLKLLPFLTNIFTSGPAAIAAGVALTALGMTLGGLATGSGSAGGGGGSSPRDRTTEIHLTTDGAGGITAPKSQTPMHFTVIGVNDPQVQRSVKELIRNADRRNL